MSASDTHGFVANLAAQYGRRLRRFLSLRLRNRDDVSDLAQEVFLRLLRVEWHDTIRSPEAYLFTVASHVAHQHTLKQSNEPSTVDITDVFTELRTLAADDPTSRAESDQRMESLQRMLAQLPPRCGAALVLHRLGGYSVQEIADEFGVARETAKKYLARAMEHCRNQLRADAE